MTADHEYDNGQFLKSDYDYECDYDSEVNHGKEYSRIVKADCVFDFGTGDCGGNTNEP